MSPQEIIAEVEKLTPEEREQVMTAMHRLLLFGDEKALEDDRVTQEKDLWEVLQEFAGKADGGMPEDMSVNHDHYLYGTPKQKA